MFQEKNGAATNKQPFNLSRKLKSYTALLQHRRTLKCANLCRKKMCAKYKRGRLCGRAGCRALLAIRLKC